MVNEAQALAIVRKNFPDASIHSPIDYRGSFVFQVYVTDSDESGYDPYYSVDQNTGRLKEFSLFTDGNIHEIMKLFLTQESEQ